ncbi:hypothetical protein J6590_004908 [Homalodisca vitripennis]|nr:hypothetical protein J6590_004908 [Homalodisca vitripennis]
MFFKERQVSVLALFCSSLGSKSVRGSEHQTEQESKQVCDALVHPAPSSGNIHLTSGEFSLHSLGYYILVAPVTEPIVAGAHVNPAVSVAMAVTRNISYLRALLFITAQSGGSIAGAALLYGKYLLRRDSNPGLSLAGSCL